MNLTMELQRQYHNRQSFGQGAALSATANTLLQAGFSFGYLLAFETSSGFKRAVRATK